MNKQLREEADRLLKYITDNKDMFNMFGIEKRAGMVQGTFYKIGYEKHRQSAIPLKYVKKLTEVMMEFGFNSGT